jgi:hypothetical protein
MTMPGNLPDRELHVLLNIYGHQNGDGSIGFQSGNPHSLGWNYGLNYARPSAGVGAALSDGNLDLSLVGTDPAFSNRIDIYFKVVGSIIGNDGNTYPVRFATATETSHNPKQIGFCWRVNNETDETPIAWPATMSVQRISDTEVEINDQSPGRNGVPYYYCLGIAIDNIAGAGSYYYITFDPKIVNG